MKRCLILLMMILLIAPCAQTVYAEDHVPEYVSEGELPEGNVLTRMLSAFTRWLLMLVAAFINFFSVPAEVIYMPGSPFLFQFSTTNIFGAFTAKAYAVSRLIANLMIAPSVVISGVALAMSKSAQMRKDSLSRIKSLIVVVVIYWFLPEILNFIFGIRDVFSYALNSIMFISGDGLMEELKILATRDGALVMDALIYAAASVFTLWLMFNYIGMSFGFSAMLVMSPIILIKGHTPSGKKSLDEVINNAKGYILTPIIDIGLLGAISTTRYIGAETLELSGMLFNMITIGLLMSVIPTRSMIKKTFGLGGGMSEVLGAGMTMAATGIALRMANNAKNSFKSGNGGEVDNDGAANYHRELAQSEGSAEGDATDTAHSGHDTAAHTELPELTGPSSGPSSDYSMPQGASSSGHTASDGGHAGAAANFSKEDRAEFLKKHQGQAYFDERHVGGLSHQEKADYYERKKVKDLKTMAKEKGLGALKSSTKFAGGMLGAGVFSMLGPSGMIAGGMIGSSLTGKALDGTATLYKGGKSIYSIMKNSEKNMEPDIPVASAGPANEIVNYSGASSGVGGEVSAEHLEQFDLKLDESANKDIERTNSKAYEAFDSAGEQIKASMQKEFEEKLENASSLEDIELYEEQYRAYEENLENDIEKSKAKFSQFNTNSTQGAMGEVKSIHKSSSSHEDKKQEMTKTFDKLKSERTHELNNEIESLASRYGVDIHVDME